MAISMTEAAAQHVRRSLEGRGKGEGIRLGVRTTGCSGLAYVLEFVDEQAAEDLVFENFGVKVFIDPKSLCLPGRHRTGLHPRGAERRLQVQQPQRARRVRLRRKLQRLRPAGSILPLRPVPRCQPGFAIDLAQLAERYRQLARETHPDRFADAPAAEQRQALARAAQLNDAYQTLKSPSRRAHYLLGLRGESLPLEATVQDPEFLLRQMMLREELEELQDSADLDGVAAFKRRLKQAQGALESEFAACWDVPAEREQASG